MLPHNRSRRQLAAVVLGVFVVGAGIGAAIVAAAHSGGRRRGGLPAQVSSSPRALRPAQHPAPASRTPGPGAPPLVAGGAGASFAQLEQRVDGAVGLAAAPLSGGPTWRLGQAQIARAWSTSKVPVLVTLLRDYESRHQSLSASERTNAAAALEQSDNAAIEALFAQLEGIHGGLVPASAAVQRTLRRAGDTVTTVNTAPNDQGFTTYGQTEWSLGGEVTFYRALAQGCLLNGADTDYVLGLMRSVITAQRWGAGSAGYPSGLPLAFKGGWGPQNGRYQVRQSAIVGSGGRGYVVSLLALPASGSFDDGTALITTLAAWARQHLELNASGTGELCSGAPQH